MEKYKTHITSRAKRDMRDIAAYIKNKLKEPGISFNIVSDIKTEILSLREMPRRYAPINADLIPEREIRKTQTGNYLIFYMIEESKKTVHVIAVLYARRDWINLL